ncbi:hypothetical protein CFOL_v3_05269, partial [Cephalotus follicularis]
RVDGLLITIFTLSHLLYNIAFTILFSLTSRAVLTLISLTFSIFSLQGDDRYFILNVMITVIFLHCSEWICLPAALLEKYLYFIENALLGKYYFWNVQDSPSYCWGVDKRNASAGTEKQI